MANDTERKPFAGFPFFNKNDDNGVENETIKNPFGGFPFFNKNNDDNEKNGTIRNPFANLPIFNNDNEENGNVTCFICDFLKSTFEDFGGHANYLSTIWPIFYEYIAPLILFIGILGNILSFIVFSQKGLKHLVPSLYFRVVAITDIIVLMSDLFNAWLYKTFQVSYSDVKIPVISCFLRDFLEHWSCHMSGAIISAIAIDRVIGVNLPHKYKSLCTMRNAYIIIFSLMIILTGVDSPSFILMKYDNGTCVDNDNYETINNIYMWIDILSYSLIPSLIIVCCNISISYRVAQSRRKRQLMSKTVTSPGQSSDGQSKISSMTIILIAVSVGYFLCTVPYFIYFVYTKFSTFTGNDNKPGELHWNTLDARNTLEAVSTLLFSINSSINFWLYLVSGKVYRKELFKLFGFYKTK